MKLWNDTQDILVQLIFDEPELRSLVISKLTKQRAENTKIIPAVHGLLNQLSENNAKLFAALKIIPEDPTLVGAIEDTKLEKAALKAQIKFIAEYQLKLKFLIKLLQSQTEE